MRLLILSDVHANPWALRAIERDAGIFDNVLFAGDAVNYGPAPQGAISWLQQHDAIGVRGNHDNAIATGADPRVSPAKQELAKAMADWTRSQLETCDIEWLAALPTGLTKDIAGVRFEVVHATPRDPLYDYHLTPDVADDLLDEMIADVKADVLITGHTHVPFMRDYHGMRIVNPGSAGQPLDGDPRAAYVLWEDGRWEPRRVEYDQTAVIDAIEKLPIDWSLCAELSDIIRRGSLREHPPVRNP
jgi:putative phosphoesterase